MKNRLLFLLILSSSVLLQSCSAGNDSVIVAGQVVEQSSGNAVQGAIVEITEPANLQKTATTDSTGNFSFGLDINETVNISLEISKQGYLPSSTTFKLAEGTNVEDLSIELSSSNNSDDNAGNDDLVEGEAGEPSMLQLVSISSSAIAIEGTGGSEQSKFVFAVRDSAGRPVGRGYQVNFSILRGPDGGEYIDPTTDFTNSDGMVQAAIVSGDLAGAVKIEAAVNENVKSTPVLVAIGNGFPESENFRIAPVNTNIEAWGLIASSLSSVKRNLIVATLGDYRNNPVLPGTAVDFTTTAGIIQSNAVTDENGLAIAELRPDGSTPFHHPQGVGFVTVTARTIDINNNYITDETILLFTSRDPSIQLFEQGTTNPATVDIPTDGSQKFTLVIKDINGYPVAAGSEISVETSEGTSNTFGSKPLGDFISPGPGRTVFGFSVSDSDDENPTEQNATVTVTVTLPSGDSKSITF